MHAGLGHSRRSTAQDKVVRGEKPAEEVLALRLNRTEPQAPSPERSPWVPAAQGGPRAPPELLSGPAGRSRGLWELALCLAPSAANPSATRYRPLPPPPPPPSRSALQNRPAAAEGADTGEIKLRARAPDGRPEQPHGR